MEEDKSKAAEWITKAAQKGYPKAQYLLSLMYDRGDGVEKNAKTASEWLKKAEQKGYTP